MRLLPKSLLGLFSFVVFTSCFNVHANTLKQGSVAASQNYSARINGVTDFLLERAQDSALYMFEQKIRNNDNLQCYFPTTYDTLNSYQQGTLKVFISSKSQWQHALRNDMETLLVRGFAKEIQASVDFSGQQVPIASALIEMMQLLEIQYTTEDDRRDYSNLAQTNIDADFASRQKINALYQPFIDLTTSLAIFKQYTPGPNGTICGLPNFNYQQFNEQITGLTDLPQTLNAWLQHLKKHKDELRPALGLNEPQRAWQAICKKAKVPKPEHCRDQNSFVEQLTLAYAPITNNTTLSNNLHPLASKYWQMVEPLARLYDNIKAIQDIQTQSLSTAEIAQQALVLIKKWWPAEKDNEQLWQLTKHIQFFALLGDAQTADEVSGILSTFALPSTGFWLKRDGESHLMVSSYFGLGFNTRSSYAGWDRGYADDKVHNHGFFVPIGLEYTFNNDLFGLEEGSISVMVSPVDFGYPINLKLSGIREDFELEDIIAPSVTFSYGLEEWPVTIGIGYQQGAKFGGQVDGEQRVLLFVAFDMPLFNLLF